MTDLSDALTDFGETAALIENLDLVITVDTSVGHLAGALGKPVWILIPKAADRRWMLGRDDSPWYPSARLFRQLRPGDWGPPIERLRLALQQAIAGSSAASVSSG
jgi:ADP-heptose:LPS heptosyltransferase